MGRKRQFEGTWKISWGTANGEGEEEIEDTSSIPKDDSTIYRTGKPFIRWERRLAQESVLGPITHLWESKFFRNISKITQGLSSHIPQAYTFFSVILWVFYTILIYMWKCSLHLFLWYAQKNISENCRLHWRVQGHPKNLCKKDLKIISLLSCVKKSPWLSSLSCCIWPHSVLSSYLHLSLHSPLFSHLFYSFSGATGQFPKGRAAVPSSLSLSCGHFSPCNLEAEGEGQGMLSPSIPSVHQGCFLSKTF